MYRIGIDIGGTFTDFAAVDESGSVVFAKYPSTPEDPSIGLTEGLTVLANELMLTRDQLLAKTDLILHGTTVATNALLEGKGAKVGMLTTEGFRDVLEQREGLKPDRYNVQMPAEPSLVPRHLRLPIVERRRFDGELIKPLDEQSVLHALEVFKEEGVEAIAICCMHSYIDPATELRVAELVEQELPGVYVSLSSKVLPEIKEFERFSSTVVNAFVGPLSAEYMQRLSTRLESAGYSGDVLIMHSHGGLSTIEDAIELGAGLVLSGPAGGIAGGQYCAEVSGVSDFITFDMGGTSSDIALLQDAIPSYTGNRLVANTCVALPSIDIHTIGSGGGSIAELMPGNILRVGPESAGSTPGPACYARGGVEATTTDANVVLGYYDEANFLGGRVDFDGQASRDAVGAIASEMGVSLTEAAHGIVRLINTQMAEGIRIVSVRAGADPRHFALLSFGGAAGLHIADIARLLDIKRVIIPRSASVLSAFGMLASDLRYEQVRSVMKSVKELSQDYLFNLIEDMQGLVDQKLNKLESLLESRRHDIALDMRYGEQIFEIRVPADLGVLKSGDFAEALAAAFHRKHEELYTYSIPEQEVVVVNVRLSGIGVMASMPNEATVLHDTAESGCKSRDVCINGEWRAVSVYDVDSLRPHTHVEGPAIIESKTTTVLIGPNDDVSITPHGWLDIAIDQSVAAASAA